MNAKIIEKLRLNSRKSSADQLIEMAVMDNANLDQFGFVKIFKEAFPQIPLRFLKQASVSKHLVGSKGLSGSDINEILGPWLK